MGDPKYKYNVICEGMISPFDALCIAAGMASKWQHNELLGVVGREYRNTAEVNYRDYRVRVECYQPSGQSLSIKITRLEEVSHVG